MAGIAQLKNLNVFGANVTKQGRKAVSNDSCDAIGWQPQPGVICKTNPALFRHMVLRRFSTHSVTFGRPKRNFLVVPRVSNCRGCGKLAVKDFEPNFILLVPPRKVNF